MSSTVTGIVEGEAGECTTETLRNPEPFIHSKNDIRPEESKDSVVLPEIVKENSDAPVLPILQSEKTLAVVNSSGENITGIENGNYNNHVEEIKIDDEVSPMENPKKVNFIQKYISEKLEGLSRRQISILIVFAFVELFAAACIAIQAPFFPKEAINKGASATASGFVFGVFELVVFISSPIYGYNMKRWNPKVVFNYGIYVTGFSCIIFGFLNYISSPHWFIFTSMLVRITEALGDAAFVTASFTIIALEFPNSVATTFATMETFYGVGAIMGPILGGILYDIGGYTVPFILMGTGLFATAAAAHYVLPNIETSTPDVTQQSQQVKSEEFLFSSAIAWIKERYGIIFIPTIAIVALSVIAVTSGVGFLADTLQQHLDKELGITSGTATGAIFILNGGTYALTAPFIGKAIDSSKKPFYDKYFTIAGATLTIVGFLLLGPVPFFPFETHLWWFDFYRSLVAICIGLVISGLGLGATLVSAFTQALKDAIANGYPDDLSTYGQVSGFWTSTVALGFFIGPVMGGILMDLVGFPSGTLFIIAEQLLVIGLVVNYLRMNREKKATQEVTDPLPPLETANNNTREEPITAVDNRAYVDDEERGIERTR